MPSNDPKWNTIKSTNRSCQSNVKLTRIRSCPICGSEAYTSILKLESFQFFSDSQDNPKQIDVSTVQCNNCFSLFMNPVYTSKGFSILFAEAGESYGSSEGRIPEQIAWLHENSQLTAGRSVFDLGCHHGGFLAALPENLRRTGIDLDVIGINYARNLHKNKNIEFLASELTEPIPVKPGSLITLLHVLEHLPNPRETLVCLNAQVDAAASLFIEVPLLENGRTNDINGFFSVTHLTHFSRATLRICIEQSGWEILAWDEQRDYNGCRVLAKPSSVNSPGKLAKSENDLQEIEAYFKNWQHTIQKANVKLKPTLNSNCCIIWGAGLHTEFIFHLTTLMKNNSSKQFILVDSNQEKHGKCWRGIPVQSPSILEHPSLTNIPVIISTYRNQEAVAAAIVKHRGHNKAIIRLYDYIRSY